MDSAVEFVACDDPHAARLTLHNRVAILAKVLSWGERDGPLIRNVLDGFERAYRADRSDIIWLPEHVEAFMRVASPEMQFAMVLALHTGSETS